ncbi:MAG: ATP-binding protein [Anaerolineae bacterium]|nr:ATP-binding protein [Anaerolineae bacterium]NUQ05309.1 PAS domain S-box protein [Anaerolineae bacterium]
MTLRRRTLIYLTLLLVGMIAILFVALQRITITSFEAVEREQITRHGASIRQELLDMLDATFDRLRDWSSWTELYRFVSDGILDGEFAEENFTTDVLDYLDLTFMLVLDSEGAAYRWEPQVDSTDFAELLRAALTEAPSHPLYEAIRRQEADSFFGIFQEIPILFAVRPILTSDDRGPSVGTLVWGRVLDAATAAQMSAARQISIRFTAQQDQAGEAASAAAEQWLTMTDAHIYAHAWLPAQGGSFQVQVQESRDIMQQARLSHLQFTMALLLFGVVLISGTLFVIDRLMLARIKRLSDAVKTIGGADAPSSILVEGDDELSNLTRALNATLLDVSASRRALEALNQQLEERVAQRTREVEAQDAQLRAIVDTMGEGLAYIVDGDIQIVNPALADMVGVSAQELLGKPFRLLTPTMEMTVTQILLKTDRYETTLLRRDGSQVEVAITATPIQMGDARRRRVIIARDITQEKAMKRQRDYFFARASHELRTPLSNIMTRLYLLERNPEQGARHLDVLNKVSHHMLNLVNDLLLVSRLEAGLALNRQPLDLRQTIQEVVDVQRSEAELKQLSLVLTLPQEPLRVHADATRMAQAFTNIVRNAILYTDAGGTIEVSANLDAGTPELVAVTVHDTGIGIDARHLPHLFEAFYRVTEGGVGAGLGLYITHEIVQLHGGEIAVASAPGVGTTFTIRLTHHPLPSVEVVG